MVVKRCGNTLEVFGQDCGACPIKPISFPELFFTAVMKFSKTPPVMEHFQCTSLSLEWKKKSHSVKHKTS